MDLKRSKVLARARRMSAYHDGAMLFSFQLLDYEEKYKKMLELIKERTPYHLIIQYVEKMINADRKSFLKELMHMGNTHLTTCIKTDDIETVDFDSRNN